MRGYVLLVASAALVAALAAAAPAAAEGKRVVTFAFSPTDPARVSFFDPCALGGEGESVQLVGGTARTLVGSNDPGRLYQVTYVGVVGVGLTSGADYTVAYRERHAYQHDVHTFEATLVATGGGTVYTREDRQTEEGLVTTESCG